MEGVTIELDDAMSRLSTQPTVSVEDVARLLGIGRSTAYAAVKSGEVPSIRVCNRVRIPSNWVRMKLSLGVDRGTHDLG